MAKKVHEFEQMIDLKPVRSTAGMIYTSSLKDLRLFFIFSNNLSTL